MLPQIRFHDLRHTAATIALGRGVHPKIVSEMLGHSTIAITLDLYSHVTPDDAARGRRGLRCGRRRGASSTSLARQTPALPLILARDGQVESTSDADSGRNGPARMRTPIAGNRT
ncbi:MAG: tyrosine-type recombinase/integrase [Thermoleophilaceae bacterium]